MKQFLNSHISSFCLSLHLALQAGISIAEGAEMYGEEENDSYRKERVGVISEELGIGEQLSVALLKSEAFPDYMVDMIEVGEKTGKLDDTLMSLSHYYDRQETIAKSIRGATTYPIMLLCVLLLVLVVFVVRILPIFYDVYKQLGAEMSGIATTALNFGNWLRSFWLPIVIVIAVIVILAIVLRTKLKVGLRKIFMGGKLGASMQGARFASILSMTLTSGMDPDEALTMAARLTDEVSMRGKITAAAKQAEAGTSLAQCVADTGIFSMLYNRMLAIGVRTGSSDTVMEEIARRTGDEANDRLEMFIGKIEPTLVIIMSLLIGLLLLSVMLPLAGIMSAI